MRALGRERENSNKQFSAFIFHILYFSIGGGGGGLIVCNTACKTMCFLTTKTEFFEREQFQNGYKQ